jgi:hypothetical protein
MSVYCIDTQLFHKTIELEGATFNQDKGWIVSRLHRPMFCKEVS